MDLNQNHTVMQIKKHRKLLENGVLDISLTEILSSESCQKLIETSRGYRDRIYSPLETLLMFIKQVINPDKSCRNIVSGAIAERMFIGKKVQSSNTGPYCKARLRLPGTMVKDLVKEISLLAAKEEPKSWKWRNREVKIADGTTLLMPDTIENQSVFPQHGAQKNSVGFPIARMVIIMSLSLGVALDYAVGAYKGKGTGEHSLFRSILGSIHAGDVLLADRYFPCFFLMADLRKIGADGVFRGQGQRHYDFRKGKYIDKKDHVTIWKKPSKPDWMDEETYANYPEQIEIREFKINGKIFVTTFLESKQFHKNELSALYDMRWKIELNLNSIKTILNMEMLSCKKPEMVLKEIGVHLLAYNIIRILIAEACIRFSVIPNQISFKGTVQLLNHFMPYFAKKNDKESIRIFNIFLRLVVSNKVGNRSGRIEPRVIKRRPKPRELLHLPRNILKEKLICKREKTLLKYAQAA